MKHYEKHPHIGFAQDLFAQAQIGDYYFKPSSDGDNAIRAFRIQKVTPNEIVYENLTGGYAGTILKERLEKLPFRGILCRENGKEGLRLLVDSELDQQFSGERIKKPKAP